MAGNHNSGRRRKPDAQKAREGTLRSDRATPDAPQYPQVETLEKPAHLARRPSSSAEWDRLLPIMRAAGTLSEAFHALIEAHCLLYADVVEYSGPRRLAAIRELRQVDSMLGLAPTTVGKVATGAITAPVSPTSPLAALAARRALHVVPAG